MNNSKDTRKGYGSSKPLDELDKLLEPDWDEDSQVTVNINPIVPATPSQFERLKHMKLPTKKQAGIGGIVVVIIGALVKIAQEMGWILN